MKKILVCTTMLLIGCQSRGEKTLSTLYCNGDLDGTLIAEDGDCDGVLSVDDCDDGDSSSTIIAEDGDCDGVLSADDCDDGDASTVNDMDCDGVLSVHDCDDGDASTVNDMDCDGVLSADDCDDLDASTVNDMDCDGVLSVDDCDDGDTSLLAIAEDGDCDGVLSVDDCDDGDASMPNDDMDCDGVLSVDDCDDGDANVVSVCLDLGGGQSMDLVLIPNGTFTMGSRTNEVGRYSDEVRHRVTLTNDYYVMTIEVTQGMFAALMGYNSHDGQTTSDSGGSYGIGNDYPAYYVSWHMAADFANTVTQRHNTLNGTNLQECYACSGSGTGVTCSVSVDPYQCNGYRMLTEAEWEYAARAGTTAAFWTPNGGGNLSVGYLSLPSGYSSTTTALMDGSDLSLYGWYAANNNRNGYPYGSKEVAQLLPNDYGLYDMSGNLWEWTQDWYGTYSAGYVTNPTGIGVYYRVIRGGDWGDDPHHLRSAERNYIPTTSRFYDVGFRLSRISP